MMSYRLPRGMGFQPVSSMQKKHGLEAHATRKGFTLIEFLVALAILGLILASVVPYILATREAARRIECSKNLSTIYSAMKLYFDHGRKNRATEVYPRTRFDETRSDWVAYTGPDDHDPFAATSAVQPNDVTAPLWLLVRLGYVKDMRVFVCPSSGGWADPLTDVNGRYVTPVERGNFRSKQNLSYSMLSPYNIIQPFSWDDTLPAGCVILADMNPGVSPQNRDNVVAPLGGDQPERQALANSNNHAKAGQNVLYAGGAVSFEPLSFCGFGYSAIRAGQPAVPGDNIYTSLRANPTGKSAIDGPGDFGTTISSGWSYDSYLLPSDDQ